MTAFLMYFYLTVARRFVGDTCLFLVLVIQAKVHASGVGGGAPLKPAGRRAKGTGKGAETALAHSHRWWLPVRGGGRQCTRV